MLINIYGQSVSLRHFPITPTQQKILTPHVMWTLAAKAWCDMPEPSCFETAQCALLDMQPTSTVTLNFPLVFFSTFEPMNITPHWVMQLNGVSKLYDSASSSNEPSLYICPVSNVLGSVPLIPCFLAGKKMLYNIFKCYLANCFCYITLLFNDFIEHNVVTSYIAYFI